MPEPFSVPKPLVAVLHAAPLPGSPRYAGQFQPVIAAVLRDAEVLAEAGVDGLLLENFGDAPFFPGRVPAVTVAAMTALACEVRRRFDLPLGINVLRNDGQSALAIAAAAGARFVRVNVLCGARVTDQGVIVGIAHDLLRDRATLGLARVRIFADVDVKHSAPLARRPIEEEADETLRRGGADGLLVTGTATGRAPEPGEVLA
ncbi:MAG: BtpA/SgcQ family protein, partial [Thermoguttaceae bacterium]|nr:BtpA/SgcQ family protein [Thermoguttaceae bacterium]